MAYFSTPVPHMSEYTTPAEFNFLYLQNFSEDTF